MANSRASDEQLRTELAQLHQHVDWQREFLKRENQRLRDVLVKSTDEATTEFWNRHKGLAPRAMAAKA